MNAILRSTLVILAAAITPTFAQQPAAPKAPAAPAAPATAPAPPSAFAKIADHLDLKDGDTVVFLGDSITHQCLYTQYVEDYYYTRYPKLHIHFHNSGVGGDTAKDALDRFDGDVAAFKPKYVTILLGMNDGRYTRYDQAIFDTYQKDMTTVLDKIAALGATAIPMTPTMFDSRSSKIRKNVNAETKEMYYNGVLSLFGSWLREQALDRGLGFVDMWSPLDDLTLRKRKVDADWTMIPDAVHPAFTGQVVMATAIIEDMVPHTIVSAITIDEEKGKIAAHPARATVSNLTKTDKGVAFDALAESLPWVLTPEAEDGYKLSTAGHHHSNEKLTVRDLAPGKYDLKIDGQSVGTFTDGQFAFGVELEANAKTPEYQQALKVATLNKQRTDEAMHPLRDLWRDLKVKRRGLATAKPEAAAAVKEAFDTWYAEFPARVDAAVAKVRGFEEQIYQANQPTVHHYEVAPAEATVALKQ
jgi:lysophospholipase L1-like esterase